jgi:hypothetical protein
VALPGVTTLDHMAGIWISGGEDVAAVTGALVPALHAHAVAAGLDYFTVYWCPPEDAWMRRLTESLGGRTFPSPLLDNVLFLPEGSTFESYLAARSVKHRYRIRTELRRPERDGLTLTFDAAPTREVCARVWPMFDEFFRIKRNTCRFKGNLFEAMRARLPPDNLLFTFCHHGQELLGVSCAHRVERTSWLMYLAHRPDGPEANVYNALALHTLRGEIERGATTIDLAYTADDYKRRLGCVQAPQVHHAFRCTAPDWPTMPT